MIHFKRWLNLKFNTDKSFYTSTARKSLSRKNDHLISLTQRISQLSLVGEVVKARNIFDQMGVRDSVSWNVMIRSYLENQMIEDAREVFDEMPDRTSFSWNTMIMGYVNAGKTHVALKLFVVMPVRDVVSWTAMVTGFCRAAMVDEAWRLFKRMPEPNAVSWSCMVSGFQQHGFPNESLHVFKEMLVAGITQLTPHLLTSALSACSDLAMVSVSEQMYCQILKRGFHRNTHVMNSAISVFVKTGNFLDARHVFAEMKKPDHVTWNVMITGFAHHGYGQEAMMIFHQMQKARVSPDGISFVGVLHGCSHCGLLHEGIKYFQSMKTDYGISPRVEHYSALVDLYARAGKLKEAYNVILEMPFEPTVVLWRTLLNGCRIKGDVELGVCAAENVLKLEPYDSSACSMVVEIFALAGKWKEVAKMRRRMKETESRKELGCSWIDVKGRTNLFTTGDKTHSEADHIVPIVELLASEISRYYLGLEGFSDGVD